MGERGRLALLLTAALLAALLGLERELPRLPSYVGHAKLVAAALAKGLADSGVPFFRVHPDPPHTHQFQVWLPYEAKALDAAVTELAEETGTALFRRWTTGARRASRWPR